MFLPQGCTMAAQTTTTIDNGTSRTCTDDPIAIGRLAHRRGAMLLEIVLDRLNVFAFWSHQVMDLERREKRGGQHWILG